MADFICPLPWRATCVTTSGHFRVCSESQSSKTRGVVRDQQGQVLDISQIDNASKLQNAEFLRDLRERMLKGQDVSDTCQRCISEEKYGLRSARKLALKLNPDFNEAVARSTTDEHGNLIDPTQFQQVIFRLGNKCNLACRMCGPSSSTGWYKEWAETRLDFFRDEGGLVYLKENSHGQVQAQGEPYIWAEDGRALQFLKSCGEHLTRINFSGGEPLLSRDHLEILRYLVTTGQAAKICLDYNTNLTVLPEEIIRLWEQFEDVSVGISIDGSPVVNEYVRYPTKTESLVRNLKRLDESAVRGQFEISPTVQIYNVFDLEELDQWVKGFAFKKVLAKPHWHILRSPKELSIYALPLEVKEVIAQRFEGSAVFSRISKAIFEENFGESFPEFFKTTFKMDQYRGQRLQDLPELWKHLGKYT